MRSHEEQQEHYCLHSWTMLVVTGWAGSKRGGMAWYMSCGVHKEGVGMATLMPGISSRGNREVTVLGAHLPGYTTSILGQGGITWELLWWLLAGGGTCIAVADCSTGGVETSDKCGMRAEGSVFRLKISLCPRVGTHMKIPGWLKVCVIRTWSQKLHLLHTRILLNWACLTAHPHCFTSTSALLPFPNLTEVLLWNMRD